MFRFLSCLIGFYSLCAIESLPPPCPSEEQDSQTCPLVRPAKTSMNASILIGQKIIHETFGDEAKEDNVYGNLDLAIDLNQWIAQGFLYYAGDKQRGLNRGNLLLTRDFKDKDVRLNFGDISTITKGLQTSIPMLGANVSKCRSIFTNPTYSSFSREEFFLNVPSEVEVYVDGILFDKVELSGGSHVIQDYPIIQGLNNVTLKIKSPTGFIETVNLNKFFFPEKLARHQTEYYLTVGFPAYNTSTGSYDYQFEKPTLSSLYRLGVTDDATIMAYFQANQTQFFTGGELIYQNPLCRNIIDVGMSYLPEFTTGFKARYSLDNKKSEDKKMGLTWSLVGEYTNRFFSYLGQDEPPKAPAGAVSGTLGRSIADWFNAQLLLSYKVMRASSNGWVAQIKADRDFDTGWSVDALAKYAGKQEGEGKFSFQLGISYAPKDEPYSVHGSYSSADNYLEVYGEYDKTYEYGTNLKAKVGGDHANGTSNGYANVIYTGRRALIGGRHYLAFVEQDNDRSAAQVTNIYAGTSLVWAGGEFGLAPPIQDSAVLFTSSTGTLDIMEDDKIIARSFNFFPAIIPSTSYEERTLTVVPHGKKEPLHCVTVHPTLSSVTVVHFPHKMTVVGKSAPKKQLSFKGNMDHKIYKTTADDEGNYALIEVPKQSYDLIK